MPDGRAPEAGRRRSAPAARGVGGAGAATPSSRPSSTRSTTACASAPPSPLLGALLAWLLIADRAEAPAEAGATDAGRRAEAEAALAEAV